MTRATLAALWRPVLAGATVAVALAVAPACSKTKASAPAETPSATAADPSVVAIVHGKPITRGELDARAAGALERLRSEEYEIRRSTLDDMVVDLLLDEEAGRRGVSREEMLKKEVDARVVRPTPQEVSAFYEKNRSRMGGRTLEQVAADIQVSMIRQRSNDAAEAFLSDLRREAKVKVTLDQPRASIAFPADAPVLGPKDAPVTIVEYSDYLCPYCQHAQATVDEVMAAYKGKVRLVHRDFLLGRPRSLATARAGLCAGEQGKFWEYRQDLLVQPGDWSDAEFATRAQRLGMNVDSFKACVASERHDARIKASSDEGQRLGVNATPTFFVNGRRMQGVKSVEQFKEMIEGELGS